MSYLNENQIHNLFIFLTLKSLKKIYRCKSRKIYKPMFLLLFNT